MKKNGIGSDYTNLADGWQMLGGVIVRMFKILGADITITGSGTETYTFPIATDVLVGRDSVDTMTNKRITSRVTTEVSSATPTINTDNSDAHTITALATAITSMTTNLSGSPTNFQELTVRIKDDGTARAITWGSSFGDGVFALPLTTDSTTITIVKVLYNPTLLKWECVFSNADVGLQLTIEKKTADYTLLAEESGNSRLFTNEGAVGLVDFDLPPTVEGFTYGHYVHAAQTVRINAELGSTVRIGTSVSASGGNVSNNVVGSKIRLTAINSTEWVADFPQGTWTIT